MDQGEMLLIHYQSTVDRFQRNIKVRGQLGFGMLLLVAMLLFRANTPDVLESAVESWICDKIGAAYCSETNTGPVLKERADQGNGIDFAFLATIAWFALDSLLILYLRWSLIIDRQGAYLRRLEKRLKTVAGTPIATEFLDLRKDRPAFFKIAQYLNGFMVTGMLIGGAGVVLAWELRKSESWFRWVDVFVFVVLICLVCIFIYDTTRAETRKSR